MKYLARIFCAILLYFSCAYGGRFGVASFNARFKDYGGLRCLAKQAKAITQLMTQYTPQIDFWCLQELFSAKVNPLKFLQQTGYHFVRGQKSPSSEFAIAYNADNWELLYSGTVNFSTPFAQNRLFQHAVFRSCLPSFLGMTVGIINCHLKGGLFLPAKKIPPMSYSEQDGRFQLESGPRIVCDKKVSKYLNLPIIQGVHDYFVSNGFTGKDLVQRSYYHSFLIHQLLPIVNFLKNLRAPGSHKTGSKPVDVSIIGGDFNWLLPCLQDQEFLLSCLGAQKLCRILHPDKYFDSRCIDFLLGLSKYPITCCDYLTIPLNRSELLGITESFGGKRTSHCSDHPLVMAEIKIDK